MTKVKELLTNGWSGWIRIGILIVVNTFILGMMFSNLKSDIKLNRVVFENHRDMSDRLVDRYDKEMVDLKRIVYKHIIGGVEHGGDSG